MNSTEINGEWILR